MDSLTSLVRSIKQKSNLVKRDLSQYTAGIQNFCFHLFMKCLTKAWVARTNYYTSNFLLFQCGSWSYRSFYHVEYSVGAHAIWRSCRCFPNCSYSAYTASSNGANWGTVSYLYFSLTFMPSHQFGNTFNAFSCVLQDQYQFCYRAALEYLGSFDHYATWVFWS